MLLLTARQELHGFAHRIELTEIVNAGRFLLLTGFVLPLLPDTPVTDLTPITPHQVWLAMVAVCTVSMRVTCCSAMSRRPVGVCWWLCLAASIPRPRRHWCWRGGRATKRSAVRQSEAGIVLATAVMCRRLLIIILVFNRELAMALAPPLVGLSALGS